MQSIILVEGIINRTCLRWNLNVSVGESVSRIKIVKSSTYFLDNFQFHHSKTDEDGVRMGCYGHMLNGKKFTTNYVADARGYRMVNSRDLISIYPQYDVERYKF